MAEQHEGASHNEQLISAARSDNEDLLLEVFKHPDQFDINFKDGLGNTALHYASQMGSTAVLEHILSCEGCDVDLQNRLEHDTPLHAAIKNLDDPELRNYIVENLLEAGANTRIKDKNGDIVIDLVSSSSNTHDDELRSAIRKAEALASMPEGDIADDDDDDDDGSDSDSDDE
ncbi:ankyrin repeat-containing domain protein [Gautieria morchelliformis]|nr:ankyrin repeat-containing domain protein [Gautieria morchelliformis]